MLKLQIMVMLERGATIEQRIDVHLEGNVRREPIFECMTTLRETAHLVKEDPLGLVDVPLRFRVFDMGDSYRRLVQFPQSTLIQGSDFLNILKAARKPLVAGEDGYQSRYAILGDWNIFSPRPPFDYERSQNERDFLAENHLANDPHIGEFRDNHYLAFERSLEATTLEEVEEDLYIMARYVKSLEVALDSYGFNLRGSREKRKVAKEKDLFEGIRQFEENDKERRHVLNRWGTTTKDIYSELLDASPSERVSFFSVLSDNSFIGYGIPFEEKWMNLRAQEVVGSLGYIWPIYVSEQDQPQVYLKNYESWPEGFKSTDNRRILKRDDGLIEVRAGSASLLFGFEKDKKGHPVFRPLDDPLRLDNASMIPLIIIDENKKTGKMEYFCGKPAEAGVLDADEALAPYDALLGQLVVAAYSENVNATLPAKLSMKFHKENGETEIRWQKMQEAQRADMVRRYERRYTTASPVVLGFKSLFSPRD